jgi:hypothetical protein
VKISLDDSKDYWKLKILSLENSFNLDLEKSFKNLDPKTSGHGLKSVSEILKYNDIELDISSLLNQGTVISLFFPKYHEPKKEIDNITKIRSNINLRNSLILISLIILLFLTNIFKTELEIQQQINQSARFKLSHKEEILLKNFKDVIGNNSDYLANYESLNQIILNNKQQLTSKEYLNSAEVLLKKIIVK